MPQIKAVAAHSRYSAEPAHHRGTRKFSQRRSSAAQQAKLSALEHTIATLVPSKVRRGRNTTPTSESCSTTCTRISPSSSRDDARFTRSAGTKKETTDPSTVVTRTATSPANVLGFTSQRSHAVPTDSPLGDRTDGNTLEYYQLFCHKHANLIADFRGIQESTRIDIPHHVDSQKSQMKPRENNRRCT